MDALDLLEAGKYQQAAVAYRDSVRINPDDMAACAGLARALQAMGEYRESLALFERVDAYERQKTQGHPGRAKDIACVLWCLGEKARAIEVMRGLVSGVESGSIVFGDLAGGAHQGLLLYYMSVSSGQRQSADSGLEYLRSLTEKARGGPWPKAVAQHLLGKLSFEAVLHAETGEATMEQATQAAQGNRLCLRKLCVILFHNGVRLRAQGDEHGCMERMLECAALPNPLVEPEWFLASYEVSISKRALQQPLSR